MNYPFRSSYCFLLWWLYLLNLAKAVDSKHQDALCSSYAIPGSVLAVSNFFSSLNFFPAFVSLDCFQIYEFSKKLFPRLQQTQLDFKPKKPWYWKLQFYQFLFFYFFFFTIFLIIWSYFKECDLFFEDSFFSKFHHGGKKMKNIIR